jgi:phytoene dehydrogenase-like protein
MAGQVKNVFLRGALGNIWYPEMMAAGLVFTLAMLHNKSAGYPIGGSLPMARAVEKRYLDLGGKIFYHAKVHRILINKKKVRGIRLADGREDWGDYVISAADGHATIFDMLEGRYVNDKIRQVYNSYPIFPPLVYVALGVNRAFPDLYGITGGISMQLEEPITVTGQPTNKIDYEIHNFDPTLSPKGKTVITVMFNSEYGWWKDLSCEPEQYEAEKQRVALEVINRLELRFPGLAEQVEMADVATPLTFERYTGNWQGSFEGFLPTPETSGKAIPKTLPGLDNFYMAGQWVQPGGGLPTGVMTGRSVVQMICKKDRRRFKAVLN